MHRPFIAVASFITACLLVGVSLSTTSAAWDREADRPSGSPAAARRSGSDAGMSKTRGHAKADGGSALAEDRPCRSDEDCTLTRVEPGKCCATLCEGRAVTRRRATELEQNAQRCAKRQGGCPKPLCRPPDTVTVAACEAGRCVTKTAGKTY